MQNSTDIWYVHVHSSAYGPYTDAQMRSFVEEGRINAQSLVSKNSPDNFVNAMSVPQFASWTNRVDQAPEPVLRPVTSPTSKGVLARDQYATEPVHQRANPVPGSVGQAQIQTQTAFQSNPTRQTAPQGQPVPEPQPVQPIQQPAPQLQPQPLQATPQPVLAPQPVMTPQPSQIAPSAPLAARQPVQAPQGEKQPGKPSVFLIMAEIRSENGLAFLQNLQQNGVVQRIGDSVWILRGFTTAQMLRNSLSQSLTADDRLFILDSFANETAWFNIGTEMDRQIRALWDRDASP